MFETQTLYPREDFLRKLEVADDIFTEWESRGLIAPVRGRGSDEAYYTGEALDRALHIKQFLELGYDLDGVQKILRKVGLPVKGKANGSLQRDLLTVGELSEKTGLGARTVKHWEEKGIIEPDGRSEGGFRLYSEVTVEVCLLVRDLQLFGFSLEEIRAASDLLRGFVDRKTIGSLDPDNPERIERLREFIGTLQKRMGVLKEGLSRWESLIRKRNRELKAVEKTMANGTKDGASEHNEGNDS